MKKYLMIFALAAISACSMMDGDKSETPAVTSAEARRTANPEAALKDLRLGCFKVKGVNDSEHGKIYYTESHHLFKYVKLNTRQGDKGFCTADQAAKAGFKPAPEHFSGSIYSFVECLHSEGSSGKCHDYVGGIYKSLQIYGEVCGDVSKAEMADTVENYAKSSKEGMDADKYEGTATALLSKYRCHK